MELGIRLSFVKTSEFGGGGAGVLYVNPPPSRYATGDTQICGNSPTCFYHFQGGIQQRNKAETCRRFTVCFYIIVSNYSTVVGIYIYTHIVTSLSAKNMYNFKLFNCLVSHTMAIFGCIIGVKAQKKCVLGTKSLIKN
jgi:hypothetical protein